jgi:hypothetical protein
MNDLFRKHRQKFTKIVRKHRQYFDSGWHYRENTRLPFPCCNDRIQISKKRNIGELVHQK